MSDSRTQSGRFLAASPFVHVRSYWDVRLVSLATLVAMLAPLAVVFHRSGAVWLQLLLVSVLVAVFWQALFALSRRRAIPVDGAVVGFAFALVAGPSVPLWQAALSLSFGVVIGEQLFGGRGHSFLNPTVVALAFLLFSFPNTVVSPLNETVAIAVLPGALLLLAAGLVSWRVVVSAVVGLIAATFAFGSADPVAALASGAFAFGLVFFACDPVAAASTNPGRWLYGLLFGALTMVLSGGDAMPSSSAVVFAALLASVLAPLIDQVTIWLNVRRRNRHHG